VDRVSSSPSATICPAFRYYGDTWSTKVLRSLAERDSRPVGRRDVGVLDDGLHDDSNAPIVVVVPPVPFLRGRVGAPPADTFDPPGGHHPQSTRRTPERRHGFGLLLRIPSEQGDDGGERRTVLVHGPVGALLPAADPAPTIRDSAGIPNGRIEAVPRPGDARGGGGGCRGGGGRGGGQSPRQQQPTSTTTTGPGGLLVVPLAMSGGRIHGLVHGRRRHSEPID
jgi:hypothetical protein